MVHAQLEIETFWNLGKVTIYKINSDIFNAILVLRLFCKISVKLWKYVWMISFQNFTFQNFPLCCAVLSSCLTLDLPLNLMASLVVFDTQHLMVVPFWLYLLTAQWECPVLSFVAVVVVVVLSDRVVC